MECIMQVAYHIPHIAMAHKNCFRDLQQNRQDGAPRTSKCEGTVDRFGGFTKSGSRRVLVMSIKLTPAVMYGELEVYFVQSHTPELSASLSKVAPGAGYSG